MKKSFLILIFLLFAAMLFSGCGGGSSSSSDAGTPQDGASLPHFTSESIVYAPENELYALTLQATSENNITYTISGGDSTEFNVNALSGEVTFKTAPDYETKQSYTFTAHANDGLHDVTQNVIIYIEEVDESVPKFVSTNEVSVAENQLKAINLRATDEHAITYSLSGTDSNAFDVNATTGRVSFKTAPDYETKNLYTFTARASDGTNVGTQNVIIHILDIDETVPIFTSSSTISVPEKKFSEITLKATDDHPLSYSIVGGDALQFNLNKTTGKLTFKNVPDYETKNLYTFTARASDGTNTATQNMVIHITNVDESAPNFVSANTVTVKENQLNAITLSATDDNPLRYSISGGDSASFDINATSGVVTFKKAPDYETKKVYTFTAAVSDGTYVTSQDVTIKIRDVDEVIPVFTSPKNITVQENQLDAITLTASDNNTLSYSISGTDSSLFNVNAATGKVTFKTAPDYETKKSYTFTAHANDGTNDTTQNITINIKNRDETAPTFTSAATVSVEENQLNAITLNAKDDATASDENNITYSISGGDSAAFNLNATTGEVTFKAAPDYETKNLYTFKATASDGVNTTTQDVNISITNVDESAPNFTSAQSVNVEENQLNAITLKATDDNNVTYAISGGDSADFIVDVTTGVVTFKTAPDYETKNSYTFSASASDGTYETTQNITINIKNIDETAPTFTSASTVSVEENQLSAITLSAKDDVTASDENNITYSISGGDSAAFNINTATGEVTFKTAPDYETKKSYIFTAHANDGTNDTTQNVTINIKNIDETAPTFTSASTVSVEENQLSAITLSAKDDATASDENNITYSISGGDSAAFNINASTGEVSFKTAPDYETKKSYTFTAKASDGTNTATQSVTINIRDVDENGSNTSPVFVSADTVTVDENQLDAITLSATDDGNITYSIGGGDSASFNIDATTGVVSFKTAPDYETKKSYTFTAHANDGTNDTTQNVTINIKNIDETAPTFTSAATVSAEENQLGAITLNAKDDATTSDENNITYSISGGDSAAFNINTATGEVTFKTAPDYETKKSYTFTAHANDGTNDTTQNITINIKNIDETAPTFTSAATVSVEENQLSAITLNAKDDATTSDENNITYSISGGDSAAFNINTATGEVSFKTAPDYETKKSYIFIAKASDGTNTATQSVTINITDVDESAPIFVSAKSVNVAENQLNAITLSATDDNNITYSISGGDSDAFNLNAQTGSVTFKTAPDYETKKSYTFTAKASDGTNETAQDIVIHITNVDETTPVFTSASTVSVEENQLNAITLSAKDNGTASDENNITYSISGGDSAAFNINASTGEVTFKTAPDYETKKSYTFTAKASDGTNSVTQNVTINIIDVDETAPVFTSPTSISVEENQLNALTLTATDDNNITYAISGEDGTDFNLNATTGKVTFKTAPDYETKNSYTIVAEASDGVNTTTQSVTIHITDVDESPPIFVSSDTVSVEENQLNAIILSATDDNNVTYFISGGDSAAFNLNATTGEVTFKTAPDYETKKRYTFTASASDGTNMVTQDVTINIIDIDESVPVFTSSASISVEENQLSAITLTATDDNTLSYAISGGDSASFNIDSASGVVTFKTAPDYETKNLYTFTASVSDGTNTVTQDVTIHITDVNEVPVFTSSATASVKENQRKAITLSAKDDNSLTYSITGGDSASFIVDSLSGVVTFKSDPDYETKNLYTFTAVVSDGTNEATQDVSIDITDVEERDKKTGQTQSYDENGTVVADGSLYDDGYYEKGVAPSYTNASGVVRDEITGLMWQDDTDVKTVTKPWLTGSNYDTCENNTSSPACYDTSGDTASSYCGALDLGGYTDWRLPTQVELEGIVDYASSDPAIDTSSFSNIVSELYWSALTKDGTPQTAWIVYFQYGSVYDVAKDQSNYVRCVREIKE